MIISFGDKVTEDPFQEVVIFFRLRSGEMMLFEVVETATDVTEAPGTRL